MATYAEQTNTMLNSASDSPVPILGLTATHHEPKPQLPTQRSRHALSGLGHFTKPFIIHPHAGSPHQKTVTLQPVRIIRRCQLPFTFLDTSTNEHIAPNSLFSAHIDILESNDGIQEKDYELPQVLIARQDPDRLLYAIERVRTRVYSVCRLARWLRERDLVDVRDSLSPAFYPALPTAREDVAPGEPWWQHTTVQTQPLIQPVKRVRMSMMRPKLDMIATAGLVRDVADKSLAHKSDTTDHDTQPLDHVPELPSPQEQLDSLAQQYLDAVYMSKTSLAYFAKGPITRIRNAFTSPEEGAPPTLELITFLRSMLLSHKASEKKYHEKLPAIIKSIPPETLSEDEAGAKVEKVSKSKKKWKLSREGVYPQEEGMVKKWWISRMFAAENIGQETMDQRVKRRVGDLRVRETLAQMILMLEIVALEALSSSMLPSGEGSTAEGTQLQDESQIQGKRRKKKFEDVGLQLDLLLDKLSIWHATEEDGIMDFGTKASRQNDNPDGSGQDGASDRLRNFCVEVIIPFYMNRLPEQALMINKKLGGPANTTPPKRKAMRPPVTSRKSGGTKEPEAKKSRRSLARVATDTTGKTGARPTRSLSRSATDSSLLKNIKREGSEIPISAIPFQRSPSRGARQSMSQIRHLQGREMDLTTTSAAVAAKLKQKQRVEEDLREAITALKKPNRDLAAGSYVADIEKRGLGSAPRARKPTNTVRKVVRDVQVSATPRAGRRTKNMIEQTPRRDDDSPFVGPAPQASDFNIPSSAVRPTSAAVPAAATTQRSVTGRNTTTGGIAETPSKGPSTTMFTLGPARRTIFDTPVKKPYVQDADDIMAAALNIFETPVKGSGSQQAAAVSMSPVGVFATPTKPASVPFAGGEPGRGTAPCNEDGEASIYDALGWNDDDEFG